jgi:hypothetical protein
MSSKAAKEKAAANVKKKQEAGFFFLFSVGLMRGVCDGE